MIHKKLVDFSSLVLHHAVVLFLLTHSCEGQSQAVGSSQPIVALVGDDITLPCYLEPAEDVSDLTVEWARPDLDPRFVHLRRDGVELRLEENPSYMGRTSLSTNKLKCGDVSMKLSEVKLSDAGVYKCLVPTSGTESVVKLRVGSVSSPDIMMTKVSNGVILNCESKGWYPEPEVLWLDGEGNLLSAGPAETVRGPDDLYTVSSRVTVEKRHSNRFTCRVQQKDINQTREAHIHVPADLFLVQSSSAVRISICLVVCLMCITSVVLVVWKWGGSIKTKLDHERKMRITTLSSAGELQRLMEGNTDMTEQEKLAYLDETKAKLDEKLKKNEEELQHLDEVFTGVKKQKEDLKKQREKLISLLREDTVKIEQSKKKLKEKAVMDKEKKMAKREEAKENLEKTKKEHETLLKDTEELLETTEGLIIKMTERKVKLEAERDQIKKYLTETKRQRDEIQREYELQQSEREDSQNESESEQPEKDEGKNESPVNETMGKPEN